MPGWNEYVSSRLRLMLDVVRQFGAWVRPQVVVLFAADAQPMPPYGTFPVEVPRPRPLRTSPAEPVEGPELARILRDSTRREHRTAYLAHSLMQQHNGHHLYHQADGSFGFTITFPDEPPWIPGPTRKR